MNRSIAPVALALSALIITACSDNSISISTNNAAPQSTQLGQFIDGPVKGASYRRGTLPQLFTTSTDGSFIFLAGERVEFRLGNISFGSIETSANTKFVTPRILARGNDSARINMARFLITLDSDQNPNNGIKISAAVKQAGWQYSGSNDFATLDSNELAEFASVANGLARRSLVSSDVAEKHLAQSEADISDGQYDYDYDDGGTDSDNDGINDPDDQCPNSEPVAIVASNGCEVPNGSNDDDNDEVINANDNCPAIANSDQADLDQDQRGDACDNDIDGDGLPNDDDKELRDADIDSDGVKDGADNCPERPNSNQTDTDADGQGDSCDSDIDNDDIDNGDDLFPLDLTENSDNDQDGIGNNGDNDDDNDGTPDNQDAFPFDARENTDSDGDGTGNNADTDDDNDGTPDTDDAFPLDASEDTDTDGDSIGNNADNDDDNDGTPDSEDAFPEDDSVSGDADTDGIGNNRDECTNTPSGEPSNFSGCSASQVT
jgi:hypothetical protein